MPGTRPDPLQFVHRSLPWPLHQGQLLKVIPLPPQLEQLCPLVMPPWLLPVPSHGLQRSRLRPMPLHLEQSTPRPEPLQSGHSPGACAGAPQGRVAARPGDAAKSSAETANREMPATSCFSILRYPPAVTSWLMIVRDAARARLEATSAPRRRARALPREFPGSTPWRPEGTCISMPAGQALADKAGSASPPRASNLRGDSCPLKYSAPNGGTVAHSDIQRDLRAVLRRPTAVPSGARPHQGASSRER